MMAVLALILGTCSCVTRPSAPEPELDFDIHLYDHEEAMKTGRCVFINSEGKRIDTDEPTIHEMALVPSSNIRKMEDKFNRCEVWK